MREGDVDGDEEKMSSNVERWDGEDGVGGVEGGVMSDVVILETSEQRSCCRKLSLWKYSNGHRETLLLLLCL